MNERLDELVQALRDCEQGDCMPYIEHAEETLSDGELCYVALASGEVEGLLPEWTGYSEIPAFFRLPPHWRVTVCRWRGWPEEWAGANQTCAEREVSRVTGTLNAASVPSRGCPMLHTPAGRVLWLVNRVQEDREAADAYWDSVAYERGLG